MALKPDRQIVIWDITKKCSDVHEAGSILCHNVAASGGGLQVTLGTVTLASNPSGYKPAGMSMTKMSAVTQTSAHRNFHNNEQVVGENVALMTKGYAVTNKIIGTPTVAGGTAYATSSGCVTATNSGAANTPPVGTFGTVKDEDGYARVDIDL